MKKMFGTLILIVSLLLLFSVSGAEAATKARTASYDKGIMSVTGLGDLSSGDTVEVDGNGSLRTKDFTKSTYWGVGTANDIASGAAVVYKIQIAGNASSSAGDYVALYDAATVTGSPKLEVNLNNDKGSNEFEIPGGVAFSTGISVSVGTGGVDVAYTIVYSSY